MKYYSYEPQLNFKPGFNIWKHNFEVFPFNIILKYAIKITAKNTSQYVAAEDLTLTKHTYTSDNSELPFYKISPKGKENELLPTIIYYHGGGFMCPIDVMMLNNGSFYSRNINCHVLLPEYRLAPNFSSTTILKDCDNFFSFVKKESSTLSVDIDNLIIYGDSAGGFLAATTAQKIHAEKPNQLKGLILIYPVTDDRIDIYQSMDLKYAEWNKNATKHMWRILKKSNSNIDNQYLEKRIPMKTIDLPAMPPIYIEVQEYDTLKDQGIALANKYKAAGFDCTLTEIKGTYHGFDNLPGNHFVEDILTKRCKIMSSFLHTNK